MHWFDLLAALLDLISTDVGKFDSEYHGKRSTSVASSNRISSNFMHFNVV